MISEMNEIIGTTSNFLYNNLQKLEIKKGFRNTLYY